MRKILLFALIFIASQSLAQSTSVITGKGLELLPIPGLSGYSLIKGTAKVTLSTDITVVNGSTGKISLDDSSKYFKFLPLAKGLTLNYTITGTGTTPPTTNPVAIQALNYISMQGVKRETDYIGSTDTGDWASYSVPITGYTKLTLEYAREWPSPATGGAFELREGNTTGKAIASGNTPNTGSWGTFKTLTFPITPSTATTVVLLFKTPGAAMGNIRSLKFE